MTRAIVLAAALASCAPSYSLATKRTPPVWLYAADMVAFSAGMIVGINELNKIGPPYTEPRDTTLMYGAFAVALVPWLSYWIANP